MRLIDTSPLPLPLPLLLLLLLLFCLSFPQGICFCLCLCLCLSVCHSEPRERTCCLPFFASPSPKAHPLKLEGQASHV
jgi:hypothetical protein